MSDFNVAVTSTIAVIAAAFGFGLGQISTLHDAAVSSPDVSAQYAKLALDSNVLPIAGSPVKGGTNALATVVVFTDFTTEASRYLYREAMDKLFRTHGDKVAVVYKSYPLRSKNDSQNKDDNEAMLRAKAAVAAQSLGKFWEYTDKMLASSNAFNNDEATRIAIECGLNAKAFISAMESTATRSKIEADSKLARKLKVKGAPAVYVNGRTVNFKGNVTSDELLQIVNDEIGRVAGIANTNYIVSTMIAEHETVASSSIDSLGRPSRGATNPLVTIVEYSDYQCPFCSKVEWTLSEILKNYPDTVRIVFNHNPLPFHTNAKLAHQAAHAAGLQGKFWEMHNTLFRNQKNLSEADLHDYAQSLDLDMAKFKADLHAPETVAAVEKAIQDGVDHDVTGTPHFLINGEPLKGALPYEQFKEKIDAAIKQAKTVQKETGLDGENLYKELVKRNTPVRQFVDISGTPSLGPADAPVTLIEFTDFQCPYCKKANETVHKLIANNPGKVRLVFKHNPLPFHPKAEPAHRAAEAAALQGKFWEMYDLLFEHNDHLDMADIEGYAAQIGLDVERLKSDMESDTVKNRVKADIAQGASVGVKGTPHFFINGNVINGAQPLDKFQKALDRELKVADKYIQKGTQAGELYKTIISEENKANGALPQVARPVRQRPDAERIAPLPDIPAAPIKLEQGKSYAKGPDNAPVTIFMFSEFQCPFCARVEPTIKQIEETYGDKVRIVFKNNPLPFHKNAQKASEAALAAGAQGKFWEMHELLFANQKNLERASLSEFAKQLGLDVARFDEELDKNIYAAQVEAETNEGKSAGVTGTPSFVINGKKVVGALPFESFQKEIDAALAAAK